MEEDQHGLSFPLPFPSKLDTRFMGTLACGLVFAHMSLAFPAPSHPQQEGLQATSLLQASDSPHC